MTTPTIAIIGAGNMGSSLIGGLLNDGHPKDKIWATDQNEEKLSLIRDNLQIQTTTNNAWAAEQADIVILAVKPPFMAAVTTNLAPVIEARQSLVLSIAAGIRESSLQQWLGGKAAIVRAMPNTPSLIKCGATALFANQFVTAKQHNLAESVLRAVSVVVWLEDEKLMDTVTALSGSGPAYFFLFMEALQQGAIELGLPKDIARLLTLQTALGAARMAMESDTDLTTLRHQVTSPGGTTEQAVKVLEECHLKDILKNALVAAKSRSEELATMF